MSAWTLAVVALLGPLAIAVVAAARGDVAPRLVAIQMASSVGILLTLALTFVDEQPSSIDLALMLALLTLPATLLFALFAERWL